MNRAPVALFALLCTLASSMVAAGVASDRPTTVGNRVMRNKQPSELKTISYSASAQEKWLTEPNWQAIDLERAVALPTKKIPTRIPEKVKPVAAIIITIEQAPAAAVKTSAPAKTSAASIAKPIAKQPTAAAATAAKTVAAKPAAPKNVAAAAAKPAAKPIAVAKPAGQKTSVVNNSAKTEKAVAAVLSVVDKMVAASKTAPIQPRVSSAFSSTYMPTKEVRGVLTTDRITVGDLHLCNPGVATTSGKLIALPIAELAASTPDVSMVDLSGSKLQIAYGSLSMLKVGDAGFVPTPFIAEDATSILINHGVSTSSKRAATVKRSEGFSIWGWTGSKLSRLHDDVIRTIDIVGRQLNRRVNDAATFYIGRIRSYNSADWVPMSIFAGGPIKTAEKPTLTK